MAASAGAVYVDVKANTRSFEQSMSGLGRLAERFGGIISKALAGAALARFGAQCVELASDLAEVQNVVDVTFPHMAEQMDAWAKGAAESFGIGELAAKRYAGTLGSMAEGMGFAEGQAYDLATDITALAGDVASFYNLSDSEAYDKLTSIFTGMVQPLRSLGINMTQASLDAYALANGFERTYQEMGEAERVMLRYEYVAAHLSNAQGDFARTSSSWANQIRILQLRFDGLRAAVGQSLILALTPVIQAVNAVILALTNAANAFYSFISAIANSFIGRAVAGVGKAFGSIAGNVSDAAAGASALADAEDAVAGSAGGAAAAQKALNRTLAGFDRINKLNADSAGGGGGGGGAGGLADLGVDGLELSMGGLKSILDDIELPERLVASFHRLSEAAGRFVDLAKEGLRWVWDNILVPLGNWTVDEFAPRFFELMAAALDLLCTVLEKIQPLWQWFWDNFLSKSLEGWGIIITGALEGWTMIFEGLNDALKDTPDLLQAIQDKFRKLAVFVERVGVGIAKVVSGIFSGDWDMAAEGAQEIADAWDDLTAPGILQNLNKQDATVKDIRSNVAGIKGKAVKLTVDDQASSKIDKVNKLRLLPQTSTLNFTDYASGKIDSINRSKSLKSQTANLYFTPVLTKNKITMTSKGYGEIQLSAFARGGYVERNSPRLAVIGDNTREGEIVSPESKFQAMLDKASSQGGSAETNALLRQLIAAVNGISGDVYLDGRAITRSVVSNMNAQTRATGRSPLII